MNRWQVGWYATRRHYLESVPNGAGLGALYKALCGARVFASDSAARSAEWRARLMDRKGARRCKHCLRLLKQARLGGAVSDETPKAQDCTIPGAFGEPVVWSATNELRWLDGVLEQRWQGSNGEQEWRPVPHA